LTASQALSAARRFQRSAIAREGGAGAALAPGARVPTSALAPPPALLLVLVLVLLVLLLSLLLLSLLLLSLMLLLMLLPLPLPLLLLLLSSRVPHVAQSAVAIASNGCCTVSKSQSTGARGSSNMAQGRPIAALRAQAQVQVHVVLPAWLWWWSWGC
jgi:hypothetical protein